jgi:hypothetical protein
LSFDVLTDVLLKDSFGHACLRRLIEHLGFMEIKAIIAVDIAGSPTGLDHRVEAIVPAFW